MERFVLASNNKKKMKEMRRILEPLGFEVVTVADAGFEPVDVEENGSTFEQNAYIKAKAICEYTKFPSIADDSGLCVDFLDGQPGIYSARFGGEGLDDTGRYELLLQKLAGVPKEKRGAQFVCSICCVYPDGKVIRANGVCKGFISEKPSGNGGFGYDPVFLLPDGRCFAEISDEQKDLFSHRGLALREFAEKMTGKVEN
ncbi:MAG: RdgB/HAM1 family non-canonical purine NTP pyrophosphatase [Clostridia bacterium]|nr:RdgB/HAM1 family non-canonical purine NTP pyrophosphatase [Clostridia bacterium]